MSTKKTVFIQDDVNSHLNMEVSKKNNQLVKINESIIKIISNYHQTTMTSMVTMVTHRK